MLYFHFHSVLCIFKISLETSSLTHGNVFVCFFPTVRAFSYSSLVYFQLILIWLENTLWYLLFQICYILWLRRRSVLAHVPWVFKKNTYVFYWRFVECLKMSVKSDWLIVLFSIILHLCSFWSSCSINCW